MSRNAWGLISALAIFALSLLAAQWFSDNFHFNGFSLVRNNRDNDN